MRRSIAVILSVLTAASQLCGHGHAATADDAVIVLQRVNTRYDLPGTAEAALAKALPATTTVRPREGLSSVISRLYAVGEHSAKPALAPLTDWIRRENNLYGDFQLEAGQALVVPDVPKLGATRPNVANPNNSVPKLSIDLRSLSELSGLVRPDVDRQVEQSQRAGAAYVVSIRELTAAQAVTALAQDPTLTLASAPLTVKLLDAPAATPDIPGAAAVAAIGAAAVKPPRQHPILLVFDDSWPDLQEEEASRTYLLSALRDLRARLQIPPMTPFNPACALGVVVASWPDGGHSHSSEVAEALAPFRSAAGPASPVKVVYLPLLADGPCASEAIAQMAEFHLISVHMADALGKQPTPADVVSVYHKLAGDMAATLDVAANDGRAVTNVEAVQGAFEFARRQGDLLHEPVFLSMSWDFPLDRYQPAVPSEFGGLFVVAAGNEGRDGSGDPLPPVATTKMQFAARSLHPGDMLAVMNIDGSGKLTCQSSLVDPAGEAFATSYFGNLDADDCGTSFSTPRVAWLLAFREAGLPALDDLTNLSLRMRQDLSAGLNGPSGEPGVMRLDFAKLLAAAP